MKLKHLPSVSLLLCLGLVVCSSGCRVFNSAAKVPGEVVRAETPGNKDDQKFDPIEGQPRLLRFSDQFLARMAVGVDKLRRGTNAVTPTEALHWKIAIGTKTCAIASGPNGVAVRFDMTVYVSAVRSRSSHA
jgi:hypothetical protein